MNLFQAGKPFFKGNLHCHSTLSDGLLTPEAVIDTYRALGYDFLAITDHRKLSPSSHMDGGMLLLSGIEMDFWLAAEALHIVGIGMAQDYSQSRKYRQGPQAAIDDMRAYGGRAIVAHPAWSLNTHTTLCALQNVTAAEIYNSVSTHPWNGDRADSSNLLDITASHGMPYRFVASDDSHRYEGEQGRAFTMVQADALTPQAVLAALDEGRFYASQGPLFHQISIENGVLSIECSPVDTIIFYSNLVWTNDRCHSLPGQTHATYDLAAHENERFVRCQLIDADGRSAWSNPILIDGGQGGRFL